MKIKDLKIGTPFYRVYYEDIIELKIAKLSYEGMHYTWGNDGASSFLKYADHNIDLNTQFSIKLSEHHYLCIDAPSAQLMKRKYLKVKLDEKLQYLASIKKEIEELKQELNT